MDQLINTILAVDEPVVFIGLMFFAFLPGSVVMMLPKLNRWWKTILVLIPGELAALALGILAIKAQETGNHPMLSNCTVMAVFMAIMMLACAIYGHIRGWKK